MSYAVIDFETFMDKKSGYTLSKISDVQFITSPMFEVISVAVRHLGTTQVFRGDSEAWLPLLAHLSKHKVPLIAHNGKFDFRVLAIRYGLIPSVMGDTMLAARYHGFAKVSLSELSRKLLGDDKIDGLVDAKRLSDLSDSEFKLLAAYNSKDVELTDKLYQMLSEYLPDMEKRLIDQTLKLCLKEHTLDWDRMSQKIETLDAVLDKPEYSKYAEKILQIYTKPAQIREYISEQTGFDPGTVDKNKVNMDDVPDEAAKILLTCWSIRSAARKSKLMETLVSRLVNPQTNKAFLDLNYSKAVTHRWSGGGDGRKSFNVQNMNRNNGIRELWIPEKGKIYGIVDFSQIEARVVAWYAGELELLTAFREGKDLYCEFGRYVFGRVLDPERDKNERQICKQAILGLGFGMGASKFLNRMEVMCGDSFTKVCAKMGSSSADVSHRIVAAYRRAYPRVAAMAGHAYRTYLAVLTDGIDRNIVKELRVAKQKGNLRVFLPTGGFLTYRDPKIVEAESCIPGETETKMVYGDKAISFSTPFENIVQATARDLLGMKLIELDEAGFDIRFHSHDEVIVMLEEREAPVRFPMLKNIFSKSILEGLPLSCSGYLSDRYTKDEKRMCSLTSYYLSGYNQSEEET